MRGATWPPISVDRPEVRYGTVMSIRVPVLGAFTVLVPGTRSARAAPAGSSRPRAATPRAQRQRNMVVLLYRGDTRLSARTGPSILTSSSSPGHRLRPRSRRGAVELQFSPEFSALAILSGAFPR